MPDVSADEIVVNNPKLNEGMKITLKIILLSLLLIAMCEARAEVTPVLKGRPAARIVVVGSEPADSAAAVLLQNFVCRINGAEPPVTEVGELRKAPVEGDILVGNGGPDATFDRPGLR